ncbi:hypothetical protein [Streptomyces glomeratus]|uniref:Integrase n=1 Tax=Streptomyces glomeratus TaxID=284452 RepID=A0ABP6M6Y2_9ACTN|nr:hypothetical protein [Streptomyces glomeratus]MCF1510409.1 hypothetical protein [Streptomyces glomeratus]
MGHTTSEEWDRHYASGKTLVRSGMATEARRRGKDRKAIAAITGHKARSKVLDGYLQIVDQCNEQDNALIGNGL